MKVLAIIPCYNEEKNVDKVILNIQTNLLSAASNG
jgi:glycosyltransferase involved in cell wall biosynthesis